MTAGDRRGVSTFPFSLCLRSLPIVARISARIQQSLGIIAEPLANQIERKQGDQRLEDRPDDVRRQSDQEPSPDPSAGHQEGKKLCKSAKSKEIMPLARKRRIGA